MQFHFLETRNPENPSAASSAAAAPPPPSINNVFDDDRLALALAPPPMKKPCPPSRLQPRLVEIPQFPSQPQPPPVAAPLHLEMTHLASQPEYLPLPLAAPPLLVPQPPPSTSPEAAVAQPPRRRQSCGRQQRQRRRREVGQEQQQQQPPPPPYPWATEQPATVHNLHELLKRNIAKISGHVECRNCHERDEIEYDLVEKFTEVRAYIRQEFSTMHDRAPKSWTNPTYPACRKCEQPATAKPVIPPEMREINWLFLFLGSMLGHCTLAQLRYFCHHNHNHKTGAKNRLLYVTYITLYNQLDPTRPFLICT